jgi:hypothetical protein
MGNEEWKEVEGYEGIYLISNKGRVKSMYNHKSHKPDALINGWKDAKGYQRVNLFKNKTRHDNKIHRLVAIAFLPNPYNKPEVNHKDGNKQNNHLSNLEWSTTKENVEHSFKIGLNSGRKGALNNKAKLKEGDIKSIRDLYAKGLGYKELAISFNIHKSTMNKIVNNQLWKHIK